MTHLAYPVHAPALGGDRLGRIASVTAAGVLATLGLVAVGTGIAFPVVDSVLATGRVTAPPDDLALFESILPFWGLIVGFGALLVAGAAGALDRGRYGRPLAIAAASLVLLPAVAAQLAGAAGSLELDTAGRAVAAALSGLAGVALLGAALSARR